MARAPITGGVSVLETMAAEHHGSGPSVIEWHDLSAFDVSPQRFFRNKVASNSTNPPPTDLQFHLH